YPERLYAGVYAANARFDSIEVSGVTPEEQLTRGRELERQGYRPVALSVAAPWPNMTSPKDASPQENTPGKLLAAGIWPRPVIPEANKEQLAKRQPNAAVALLRLGQPARAWPLLRHQPDSRARSYFLARVSALGADARALARQLEVEKDESVQRAL